MSSRSRFAKMPEAYDRAFLLAREAGWKVTWRRSRGRGSSHACWKPPGSSQVIFTSATPSDHRTIRNELSLLRRAGLDI